MGPEKSDQRWHFIVGEGAQTLVPKWRCDHQSNQMRCRELGYSYGVVPLDDPMGRESDRPVKWIGYKVKSPSPFAFIPTATTNNLLG